MKKYLISFAFILMVAAIHSCNTLDIPSRNNLDENTVFRSKPGIEAVLVTCYGRLPIAAHNTSVNNVNGDDGMMHSNWNNPSVLTGEALVTPLRVSMAPKSWSGGYMTYWNYSDIRYVNIAIKALTNNADAFTDQQAEYNQWLGELYFCRAWIYAYMCKCYGGVPIVTEAPSYMDLTEEEMYIPRNTEKEVVDFVAADLDKAMELMTLPRRMTGCADRYIAANLKARVMLFAASEAKNGTVQIDGRVGIPAGDATEYYKKAYAAAQMAIANNGTYALYRRYDDGTPDGKTENYWRMFLDETVSNRERMFIKGYDVANPDKARPMNWPINQMPARFNSEPQSGELSATVEWLQLHEDVDGNPFTLNVGTADAPVRYDNTLDLFAKANPRMRATVLLPGSRMPEGFYGADEIFEVRAGIYETYPGTLHTSTNYTDQYNGMTIQGSCGMGNTNTNGNGCVVWKYVDPSRQPQYWQGDTDWIEMRYAEVLLNKAEAAVNIIGEEVDGAVVTMQDVLDAINPVRNRAGLPDLSTVTEQDVIRERRCELAFENQLQWDFKRWRMFEDLLQNKIYSALYPYYVANEDKYIFLIKPRNELQFTFEARAYYSGLPGGAITRNPKLLPNNPGY